ncbi:MAG: hypothetical protein KC996_09980 [Phycisphaerales bacterium]|nr:hypothetical protein [Phycisphaerales bacterium]
MPEYHLMAVKCPECGRTQPAGVVAQPWRFRRLKQTVLSTVWWLLFFVLTLGTSSALYGVSQSTAFMSVGRLVDTITVEFMKAEPRFHVYTVRTGVEDVGRVEVRFHPQREINPEWWDKIGRAQVSKIVPFDNRYDLSALNEWLWFIPVWVIGASMLYALLQCSDHAIHCLVIGSCIAFSGLLVLGFTNLYMRNYGAPSPHEAAMDFAMPMAWLSFAVGSAGFVASYLFVFKMAGLISRKIPTTQNIN